MAEYDLVKNATDAINTMVLDKEKEIETLEKEIYQLKQTKRMLNTEFISNTKNNMVN